MCASCPVMKETPLVSVGMTVYNAERFLEKSLLSLLSQEYNNLEIIISDNASTDRSSDICREFASKDRRICYLKNNRNIGAMLNHVQAFNLATGKYFMWASDHDLWSPSFISKLVELMETDDAIVLAYPKAVRIDADDKRLWLVPDKLDTRGVAPADRLLKTIGNCSWCTAILGLFRTNVLKKVTLGKSMVGADNLMLAELSLHGNIAQLQEELFSLRENRPLDKTPADVAKRQLAMLNANYDAEQVDLPWSKMLLEHLKILKGFELPAKEREQILGLTLHRLNRISPVVKEELARAIMYGKALLDNTLPEEKKPAGPVEKRIRILDLLSLLQMATMLVRNEPELLEVIGRCQVELGLFPDSDINGLIKEGEEIFSTNDMEGAKAVFDRALQMDPNRKEVLNNLGVIAFGKGEVEEALFYFARALEIDGNYGEALSNMGNCFETQGNYREAARLYRRALELNPGNADLQVSLKYCLDQK